MWPWYRSRARISVTASAVTSTTNITGFFTCTRGSNLVNEAANASRTIFLSHNGVALRSAIGKTSLKQLVEPARCQGEMFDDRTQRIGREEGQRRDDDDHADQQQHEDQTVGRKRSGARRNRLLGDQRTRQRQYWHLHQEAPEQHHEGERHVVEGRIGIETGEGRSVVRRRLGVGIKDLRKTVRSGIGDSRQTRLR